MRKMRIILSLLALVLTQSVFADEGMMMGGDRPCAAVARACMDAGYGKKMGMGMGMKGNGFWMECMKPIMMGQSVKGVNVDAATAKSCREHRIEEMQKDLKDLQSVK